MAEVPRNNPTAAVKLHLDEETGEMVSKSERRLTRPPTYSMTDSSLVKKRQKTREVEKKKAEKAAEKAAASPVATASRTRAADEEELDPKAIDL